MTEKNNDQRAFHAETVAEQEAAGVHVERAAMVIGGGWQPIETAPKDAKVWAFNGEQAVMEWSQGYADNGEGWALWIWSDETLSDIDPEPEQPTHWMPLPAPPRQLPPTDPCNGMNCGCTDGVSHSPECMAQTAATYAGGYFVKASAAPQPAPATTKERRAWEDGDGRWETGFRNIVTILGGVRESFEIREVVEAVRALTGAEPEGPTPAWWKRPAPAAGDEREMLSDAEMDRLHNQSQMGWGYDWRKFGRLVEAAVQASAAHRREDQRDATTKILLEEVRTVCGDHIVKRGDDFALGADRLARKVLGLLDAAMQRTAAPAHGEDGVQSD